MNSPVFETTISESEARALFGGLPTVGWDLRVNNRSDEIFPMSGRRPPGNTICASMILEPGDGRTYSITVDRYIKSGKLVSGAVFSISDTRFGRDLAKFTMEAAEAEPILDLLELNEGLDDIAVLRHPA